MGENGVRGESMRDIFKIKVSAKMYKKCIKFLESV